MVHALLVPEIYTNATLQKLKHKDGTEDIRYFPKQKLPTFLCSRKPKPKEYWDVRKASELIVSEFFYNNLRAGSVNVQPHLLVRWTGHSKNRPLET